MMRVITTSKFREASMRAVIPKGVNSNQPRYTNRSGQALGDDETSIRREEMFKSTCGTPRGQWRQRAYKEQIGNLGSPAMGADGGNWDEAINNLGLAAAGSRRGS